MVQMEEQAENEWSILVVKDAGFREFNDELAYS